MYSVVRQNVKSRNTVENRPNPFLPIDFQPESLPTCAFSQLGAQFRVKFDRLSAEPSAGCLFSRSLI